MVFCKEKRFLYERSTEMRMGKYEVESSNEKQDCEVLFSESRWHNERSLRHTLRKYMPAVTGTDKRAKNDTIQTYFDTERGEFRCFKKANLLKIV